MAKPTEEEIEAWLNQVHEGPAALMISRNVKLSPEEPPKQSPS